MIAVILGTGPSLTKDQLDHVYQAQQAGKCKVFGMNHIWQDFPTLDVFMACNLEYYDYYWDRGLKYTPCQKWTWHKPTADKYQINHVEGIWADGFSKDPNYIHLGHSSGFQAPGLAYNLGYRKLVLLGYDMGYAPDYDGKARQVGSKPRHYFDGGEYPAPLQHWPSVKVKNGVFIELIEQFEKVKEINPDVEIINCSPGSYMTCFPIMDIKEAL
jgi:hypothetical protein